MSAGLKSKAGRGVSIHHLLALATIAMAAGFIPVACVGDPPNSCRLSSDCGAGAFCDGSGFCYSECRRDADCPCGSTCTASCGICVRDDQRGPATCLPFQHGLTTAEVLGACIRPDGGVPAVADQRSPAAAGSKSDASTDSRDCPLELPTLPICLPSPPADAGSDANGGGSGSGPSEGGVAGEPNGGGGGADSSGTGGAP